MNVPLTSVTMVLPTCKRRDTGNLMIYDIPGDYESIPDGSLVGCNCTANNEISLTVE